MPMATESLKATSESFTVLYASLPQVTSELAKGTFVQLLTLISGGLDAP